MAVKHTLPLPCGADFLGDRGLYLLQLWWVSGRASLACVVAITRLASDLGWLLDEFLLRLGAIQESEWVGHGADDTTQCRELYPHAWPLHTAATAARVAGFSVNLRTVRMILVAEWSAIPPDATAVATAR